MKSNIMGLLVSLFVCTLAACNKIIGEGSVVTEHRSFGAFTEVETNIPGRVSILTDPNYSMRIETQQNVLDVLETEVQGSILKISMKKYFNVRNWSTFRVYVYMPRTDAVVSTGSGNVEVLNGLQSSTAFAKLTGSGNMSIAQVNTANLNCELTGSGHMEIKDGSTSELHARVTGSGDLKAKELYSEDAVVAATGSGSATVRVNSRLRASVRGSGHVNYYGTPQVDAEVTGSGKVKRKG